MLQNENLGDLKTLITMEQTLYQLVTGFLNLDWDRTMTKLLQAVLFQCKKNLLSYRKFLTELL